MEGHGGAERLALGSIDVTLSWMSALVGEVRLHTIELQRLSLDVRRDASGQVLAPGGYLFVGHSESLTGLEHGLGYVRPGVYVR